MLFSPLNSSGIGGGAVGFFAGLTGLVGLVGFSGFLGRFAGLEGFVGSSGRGDLVAFSVDVSASNARRHTSVTRPGNNWSGLADPVFTVTTRVRYLAARKDAA